MQIIQESTISTMFRANASIFSTNIFWTTIFGRREYSVSTVLVPYQLPVLQYRTNYQYFIVPCHTSFLLLKSHLVVVLLISLLSSMLDALFLWVQGGWWCVDMIQWFELVHLWDRPGSWSVLGCGGWSSGCILLFIEYCLCRVVSY